MSKCKICQVPLVGFWSKIPKILFGVKPSSKDSSICNKCINKNSIEEADSTANRQSADESSLSEGKKYKCQICGRMVHEEHSLEHIKAEEYLLTLIQKDHPQWQDKDATCEECVEYYRKLIRKSEI